MTYAFVRCMKIKNRASLRAAEKHARGQDRAAKRRRREDATTRALAYALASDGELRGNVDSKIGLGLEAAFDRYLTTSGVLERKGATLALHLIVGISPAWILAAGDPHDPDNPRVRTAIREAVGWANREFGGVWAARYDLDEKGSGIVDVLCSPSRSYSMGGGEPKARISTAATLRDLAMRRGVHPARSYSALQDSWAEWAARRLDPSIKRGRPKVETGREHLEPEDYAAAIDAEAQAALDRRSAELDRYEAELDAWASALDSHDTQVALESALENLLSGWTWTRVGDDTISVHDDQARHLGDYVRDNGSWRAAPVAALELEKSRCP